MSSFTVNQVVGDAYRLTFSNLRLLARIAVVPVVLMIVLDIAVALFAEARSLIVVHLANSILSLIIQIPIWTSWHRFALLPRETALPTMGYFYRRPELRYLRHFVVLLVLLNVFSALALVVLMAVLAGAPQQVFGYTLVLTLTAAVVAYTRCGLAFPAAAVGDPMTLSGSWKATQGQGLRIFGTMLLAVLPFAAVALILGSIQGTLYKAYGAGNIGTLVLVAVGPVVSAVTVAVVAATLSGIYRQLAGYDPATFASD